MKVMKIICLHCGKVIHDIPNVFRKDPRVEIEVVYGFCSYVTDEDKKRLLRWLREKATEKK